MSLKTPVLRPGQSRVKPQLRRKAAKSAEELLASAQTLHPTRLDRASLGPRAVLQLQRTAGNVAVNRLLTLQRKEADPLPTADELTTRIARCIGIWETNRGKDDPAPKESSLDTVAGVHASMATVEQATMPYAISALKAHKSLRDKATPPLTLKELNDAEARCTAVVKLLKAVATADAAGTSAEDFIQTNAADITATGLSNDDVKTMFSAVTLKATIDAAHTNAEKAKADTQKLKDAEKDAAKKKKLDPKAAYNDKIAAEIAAIPEADRLGLDVGSLKGYIRQPKNWGENRAGWQRKAVNAMPDSIGTRIEQVSVADNGTALAIPVVKSRVNVQLAKKPVPSLEDIVKTVAQQNNPNETDYGKHVWETYDRLY